MRTLQFFCGSRRSLAWMGRVALSVGLGVSTISHPLTTPASFASLEQSNATYLAQDSAADTLPAQESIDAFVEEMMAQQQIPGLSLAVIHDRKLIKTQGYGRLDRELGVKTRPSSIFPIASVSKPLTATAIMLLVQDGEIELDDAIANYLPNSPEHWDSITIRQLLTHTAGLSEAVYNSRLDSIVTPDGFLTEASSLPLDFQPGETWMYSNTGYNLAATIVENVSQQPFETFMETRIFAPLDMNNTDVLRDSYRFSNRAMGYWASDDGSSLESIDVNFGFLHRVMPMFRGSGSITSNVVDMAKWAIAIEKGELLNPTLQAEMQTPTVLDSGLVMPAGMGWFVDEVEGHAILSHGGNLWGYSTAIARFPDDQLTVIVLANKDNASGEELAQKIAEQYVPALAIDRDAPAIADPTPEFTTALLAYVNGDSAAIASTPERQLAFTTPRGQFIQDFYKRYAEHTPTESLALIAQESHPNGTKNRYRAVTHRGLNIVTVVVTPTGLVHTIRLSTEEASN